MTSPSLPSAPLHERLGIIIEQMTADEVTGSMPVAGNTQPFGALHGGATAALAEGLASIAANLHAAGSDLVAVGLDLNITHHRAVRDGSVHGVATAIQRGRTIASYGIRITDDAGRIVSTARLTCALVQPPS
jgi:1,4-dihydroxy-2-naphthoyl-CoA hydrolase